MPENFLKNITPREYQRAIFETCKEKNCLVVIPTGLGKTLIALMLVIDRIKRFPDKKILFLAPTKPLAEQHIGYFKKNLPELFADIQLFTGAIKAEKRKQIWQTSDIVFSTPQCIANDLKKGLYNLKDVSLLIEDEAHRCIKNYDYNYIAQTYRRQSLNQRIMGLTASPGSESSKIKEICKNLSIEKVELRTRESEDVKKYLQELDFEKISVDFPPEFEEIKQLLSKLFNRYIEELRSRKIFWDSPSKTNLIKLQKDISKAITKNRKNFNYLMGASTCAQAIKLQHALELLETQTLQGFNKYLKDLYKQSSEKKSKGIQRLTKSKEFNKAYMLSQELIALNREHPKIERLQEIVKQEKQKNRNLRIIIFAQFRETVKIISEKINEISGVKAETFVGQAKKEGTGLSQKEQKKVIIDFSQGETNVLCATSLHPEEFIILKNKNKVMVKRIGEFVDSFIKQKNKALSKKINNWEALSSDGKKLFFKPVTHIHRHLAKNNLAKIKTKSGFDCLITKDHSLFSFNENNHFIHTIPKKNKFIALAFKYTNNKINQKIDVLKEIQENTSEKEREKLFGTLKEISQPKIRILKTNYEILKTIKNKNISISEITRNSKKDYSTVMNCLVRLKKENYIIQKRENKNFKKISSITSKGRDYLDFLEWFFENVYYHKKKYRFKINNKNKKQYSNFFKQEFNIHCGKVSFPREIKVNKYLAQFLGFYVSEGHVRKTKETSGVFLAARIKEMQELMAKSIEKGLKLKARKNWRGIAIDSQVSYYLVKDVFKAGIGAYNKEVPEIIFTSNDKIKWAFLHAYFLGDGYSSKDRIVFTTASRKLITGLVFLLRMLGIEKITLHKQGNIYKLNIFESLPFAKIDEKNEKFHKRTYYSLIPRALIDKKYYSHVKNLFNKSTYKSPRIKGKWEESICFDYIKDIKNQRKTEYVYDISVKGTENFVGGTGLFCMHNSIAEEGLDIPEVNSVIFYESVPSIIRTIQRTGRTARLMKGKLFVLITKKTRDESFYYVSRSRNKKMNSAIKRVQKDLTEDKKQKKLF